MRSVDRSQDYDEVFDIDKINEQVEKVEMISNLNSKHKKLIIMQEQALKNMNLRNSVRLYESLPIQMPENLMQSLYDLKRQLQNEVKDLEADRDKRLLEHVVTMRDGKGFGELALKRDKLDRRAATIKAEKDCFMAAINKDDYQKVVAKIDQRKLRKLIDFFKSIPFLSKNSKTYLTRLHYSFEQRDYIRNQDLYREGEPCNYVFLVKHGEFEVTRKIKIDLKRTAQDRK